MPKKEIIIKLLIILAIFTVGFLLRLDTIHLPGVSDDEKAFYEDQNGLPYMYEMDSYYNYRLTKNYLEHGYSGDTIINGQQWDLHSYYPGVPMDYPPLIVYLTAFVYELINLFTSIPLLTVCFWLPAIIGPISGIIAYFMVSRLTNDYGGMIAGILTVTVPFYFIRSISGWFDTDMFNVLFPLLIIWFLFEAIHTKNTKQRTYFAILSSFSMFLFALAWNGWQYLFYIITVFSIIYILYGKIKGNDIKNIFYVFITFFIISLLLISITNFLNIIYFIFGPLKFIQMNGSQNLWSSWPDLYISVAELTKPSLDQIIVKIGPVLFGLGLFSIFFIIWILMNSKIKKYLNKIDPFSYLFLVVWTLTGVVSLTQGVRFILLLVPPLVITVGITIGIGIEYINTLKIKKLFKTLSFLLIILVVVIPSVLNAYDNIHFLTPEVNDDLANSAEWIQNNTPNSTVIVTDWSYGHFFSAIANRPVAFDGRMAYIETLPVRQFYNNHEFNPQSPSTSREYWIDKAFSTSNESLSSGILTMISTSGDDGYLVLDNYTGNTSKSVEILNNILGVNKNSAKNILINKYKLSPNKSEEILKYTHPDNPNPFVIVTSDNMIDTANWIFYFGEWDFNKRKGGNYTYLVSNLNFSNGKLNSDNNITGDLSTNNITWNGKTPYCEIVVKNSGIEKHYLDKNSDFCIILLMDTNKSVILDKRFENSIFTKLTLEKSNLASFKAIYKNKSVVIWKTVQKSKK